jgi:hypothetical protein
VSSSQEWKSIFIGSDAVKGDSGFVGEDFILLTDGAPFYVVRDPPVHSCPFQLLFGLLDGFIPAWVSHCRVICLGESLQCSCCPPCPGQHLAGGRAHQLVYFLFLGHVGCGSCILGGLHASARFFCLSSLGISSIIYRFAWSERMVKGSRTHPRYCLQWVSDFIMASSSLLYMS